MPLLGVMDLPSGDFILLLSDRSDVFVAKLLSDHCLHEPVVVSEDTKLARSDVELVNELASFLRNLCIDQFVDVTKELLTLAPVVESLLFFHVEKVLELVLSDVLSFDPSSELAFAVLKKTLAEDLQTLIEIFHGKHDTGAACECFHFGAPVSKFGEERLHEFELIHDVKMTVFVN